jgi:hypothetical protein
MLSTAILRNLFHAGYVVRSVDAVIADMSNKFGIDKWKILRLPEGYAASALAYAYANNVMIELVEVNLKEPLLSIHRDWVPDSASGARLNHFAYLIDSEDELTSLVARLNSVGVETASHASFGDIFKVYYYLDTVRTLGHYCEFVCLGPAGHDFLADVPHN